MVHRRAVVVWLLFLVACSGGVTSGAERLRPGPTVFVLESGASDDVIVKVSVDAHSRVLARAHLGGVNSQAQMLPGGPIAAVTQVAIGETFVARLKFVDPTTMAVTDAGEIADVPFRRLPVESDVLTSPAAPGWVAVRQEREIGTADPGRSASVFSADVRNLRTGERLAADLDPETDWSVLTLGPGGSRPLLVLATAYHDVVVVDVRAHTTRRVTTAPFSPSPVSAGVADDTVWPLRGLLVNGQSLRADAVDRAGMRYSVDLATGATQAARLPIADLGDGVFLEKLVAADASPVNIAGVAGEDPEGQISSLVFLDAAWAAQGKINGLSVVDFAIDKRGQRVVTLGHDGSVTAMSVPGGEVLSRGPRLLPHGDSIVGTS